VSQSAREYAIHVGFKLKGLTWEPKYKARGNIFTDVENVKTILLDFLSLDTNRANTDTWLCGSVSLESGPVSDLLKTDTEFLVSVSVSYLQDTDI